MKEQTYGEWMRSNPKAPKYDYKMKSIQKAEWIKCINCRKLFTQTIYKKKKSIPICPHCKTLNQ